MYADPKNVDEILLACDSAVSRNNNILSEVRLMGSDRTNASFIQQIKALPAFRYEIA